MLVIVRWNGMSVNGIKTVCPVFFMWDLLNIKSAL